MFSVEVLARSQSAAKSCLPPLPKFKQQPYRPREDCSPSTPKSEAYDAAGRYTLEEGVAEPWRTMAKSPYFSSRHGQLLSSPEIVVLVSPRNPKRDSKTAMKPLSLSVRSQVSGEVDALSKGASGISDSDLVVSDEEDLVVLVPTRSMQTVSVAVKKEETLRMDVEEALDAMLPPQEESLLADLPIGSDPLRLEDIILEEYIQPEDDEIPQPFKNKSLADDGDISLAPSVEEDAVPICNTVGGPSGDGLLTTTLPIVTEQEDAFAETEVVAEDFQVGETEMQEREDAPRVLLSAGAPLDYTSADFATFDRQSAKRKTTDDPLRRSARRSIKPNRYSDDANDSDRQEDEEPPEKMLQSIPLVSPSKPDDIELQRNNCLNKRYGMFPRCITCVRRQYYHGPCRFAGFRVFQVQTIGEKERIDLHPEHPFMTEALWNKYRPFPHSQVCKVMEQKRQESIRLEEKRRAEIPREMRNIESSANPVSDAEKKYIAMHAGPSFFHLLQEELEVMKQHQHRSVFRKPAPFLRQSCENCSTTIFNCFWFCTLCGSEICLQCFDEWKNVPAVRSCTYKRLHCRGEEQTHILAHKIEHSFLKKLFEDFSRQFPDVVAFRPVETTNHSCGDCSQQMDSVDLEPVATSPLPTTFLRKDELTLREFQGYLKRGEAFVVTGFSETLCQWTSEKMQQNHEEVETLVVDCKTGEDIKITLGEFFRGFKDAEQRRKDKEGKSLILKLKDWPTNADFENIFPHIYRDFMDSLPMPQYTARDGHLNLWSYIHPDHLPGDLGPKMYNGYSSEDGPGDVGSTNIHLDMTDAVNVMLSSATVEGDNSHGYHPAGAPALWTIYPRSATPHIRSFLRNYAEKLGLFIDDPIHDQAFYMTRDMRAELAKHIHDGKPVVPYEFYQYPGQAVFIPAGCVHQVCNVSASIKVAMDFVSPENMNESWILMEEFRKLSANHKRRTDILQVKQVLFDAFVYLLYGRSTEKEQ